MTDLLKEIRRELAVRIAGAFILTQLIVLAGLTAVFFYLPWKSLVFNGLFFLILELSFFLFFLRSTNRYFAKKLGSQADISRVLFKNTRNIINNVSHEWRTPLNAIMGFTDELYEKETHPAKKEALKAVKSNSRRLYSMSKKLIDFSSIETGLYEMNPQFNSIDSLLMNLRSNFGQEAEDRQLRFTINNTIPPMEKLLFDFHALYEILTMIVENSFKFTREGEITITAEYVGSLLTFRISDTGTGIDESKKKLVFEMYRQGNSDLNREYEGIGLGLTIAQKLIEMAGGRIDVKDNKPSGTVFVISLETESQTDIKSGSEENPFQFPPLLPEQSELLRRYGSEIGENLQVFDSGKISLLARKMAGEEPLFTELADRITEAAGKYDEAAVTALTDIMVEEAQKNDD